MKTTDRDLGYVFVVSSGCRVLAVCGDDCKRLARRIINVRLALEGLREALDA